LELATGATVTGILDEDDLATDSATQLATQQSIKKYIDDNKTTSEHIIASDATWDVPLGITKVYITMCAGGGGGGTGSGAAGGGGGGASGGWIMDYPIAVTPEAEVAIVIGAGGAANIAGGDSSFGAITVTGGEEGDTDVEGAVGGASLGSYDAPGGNTAAGIFQANGAGGDGGGGYGSGGGGTPWGTGGAGTGSGVGGAATANTGAGGGGGKGAGGTGGAGGSGICIIMY